MLDEHVFFIAPVKWGYGGFALDVLRYVDATFFDCVFKVRYIAPHLNSLNMQKVAFLAL